MQLFSQSSGGEWSRRAPILLLALMVLTPVWSAAFAAPGSEDRPKKVGVLYVVHGASRTQGFSHFFDAAIQMGSYDPNSPLFKTIWQPENWPGVVPLADPDRAESLLGLYRRSSFEFDRSGNLQPATQVTEAQAASLQRELERLGKASSTQFVVDWVSWIAGTEDVAHLPYPRFIYDRDGQSDTAMRYCGGPSDGGAQPDGRWPQCNPERYNVDGPMDRLLRAGVEVVVLVDTTVGGVRFSKTFDIYRMLRAARDKILRGTDRSAPMIWANDPTGLMEQTYPIEPAGWTASMGPPRVDPKVPLERRGNPVTDDPEYASAFAEGIFQAMSGSVAPADTGVLLFDHGIFPGNEVFDPKISDTLRLLENLQAALLKRYPSMSAANIVGGWEGIKQLVGGTLQRTRQMRGEDLGYAFLYESNGAMPPGKWGLRYWDALDRLKKNGVKHIIVAFPQVVVTTTVGQVGLPNQIAKEIGYRGFRPVKSLTIPLWPGFDGPFADHWPPDASRLCRATASPRHEAPRDEAASHECCYRLSGCFGGVTYPETRQTPLGKPMSRLDPELVFDVPPFGHLGYDPGRGLPNSDSPVQGQYAGTWSIWVPLDDDPKLAKHLGKVVMTVLTERDAKWQ